MRWLDRKLRLPTPEEALPGRTEPMPVAPRHAVLGTPMRPPFPEGCEVAIFGLGCFWGAERRFWETEGVVTTAVGYAGGHTPNPTYEEVCTGRTGHAEVVQVVYDPARVRYRTLLRVFFESHDPTQGMRQGNDVGTPYRSAIYTTSETQHREALEARERYGKELERVGHGGPITTEIREAAPFYYAEDAHQQYLAKNPMGYCGLGGTGVPFPADDEEPGAR